MTCDDERRDIVVLFFSVQCTRLRGDEGADHQTVAVLPVRGADTPTIIPTQYIILEQGNSTCVRLLLT